MFERTLTSFSENQIENNANSEILQFSDSFDSDLELDLNAASFSNTHSETSNPHISQILSQNSKQNDCNSLKKTDIGDLDIRFLTAEQKYSIIYNHLIPTADCKVPFTLLNNGKKATACFKHLESYNWLIYSVSKEGYYCKYCSTMSNFTNIPQAQTLMLKPLNNFKKLKEKLNEHESNKYHKDNVAMG